VILAVADPALAAWVARAIRERAAVWRRNGLQPPAGALALADELLPSRVADRHAAPDPAERARALARERTRRWRARQRGEDVPLRRPGPPPDRHTFA